MDHRVVRFVADDADADLEVSNDGLAASCAADAWRGVRSDFCVSENGTGRFEVIVVSGVVRIGWCTKDGSRVMGTDSSSFGFGSTGKSSHNKKYVDYGETFGEGDCIGCSIERSDGARSPSVFRISFSKNGRDLGAAFDLSANAVPDAVRGVDLVAAVAGRKFEVKILQHDNARAVSTATSSSVVGNAGYAFGQLNRAALAGSIASVEDKQRFANRVANWSSVISSMASGELQVGSRQPTGEPVWVTPKVLHGGFCVPGAHMAGGDLQEHELEMARNLGFDTRAPEELRRQLNEHFASTPEGLAELEGLLTSGCYRAPTPEEAALLCVVALLSRAGGPSEAEAALCEIRPWFSKLRFFPVPSAKAQLDGAEVSVATVSDVRATLKRVVERGGSTSYEKMRHSMLDLDPMYDTMVALTLETLPEGGTRPWLEVAGTAAGDFPFKTYPPGWYDRVNKTLARLDDIAIPKSRKGNVGRLAQVLRSAVGNKLTGRDVSFTRTLLAQIHTSRGLPGDPRHIAQRQEKAHHVKNVPHSELASALRSRLGPMPQDEGLEPDAFTDMIQGQPKAMKARLRRAKRATLQELVAEGVVKSADQLSKLTPSVVAEISAVHSDPDLRKLDRTLYKSFRGRRSLLLLNLASQVRIDELPWAKPIMRRRTQCTDAPKRAAAELCAVALRGFPQTILPNPFITEMHALLNQAIRPLAPLTKEVAADIFEHAFSQPFEDAAMVAWSAVRGTCYARYYDLKEADFVGGASLYDRCKNRVQGGIDGVAGNGMIIEQQQILTTHNLAVLFEQLALKDVLRLDLFDMALNCWQFICRSLSRLPSKDTRGTQGTQTWRVRLQSVKQVAYAQRQMLFFLSRLPANKTVMPFLTQAQAIIERQPKADVRKVLEEQLMPRLRHCLPQPEVAVGPLLGWSSGGHPLLQAL
eukprot:TRINITY_DN102427_c0_g1_i1.p1 TRINITY_DN102427_c0_g1~~TRINITY_DN102427_c0_g1_i1.p1  ORF type:complete len:925 (-),score=145.17 TRINITY_DN102427_c0_g1_i1:36-2810(-)